MEICNLNDPKCFIKIQHEVKQNIQDMTSEELKKTIFDGNLEIKVRLDALVIYSKKDESECLEILQQILSMYMFSSSSILEQFIEYLCINTTLVNIYKKIDCLKVLYSSSDNNDLLINLCKNIYEQINKNKEQISPSCYIDVLLHLYSLYEYTDKLTTDEYSIMCEFYNNQNIEANIRYKYLINLDKQFVIVPNLNKDDCMSNQYKGGYNIPEELFLDNTTEYATDKLFPKDFVIFVYLSFINNDDNDIMYKILLCQYLLQLYKKNDESYINLEHNTLIQDKLLDIANNKNINYNLRADSSDVLMTLGDGKYKDIAMDIMVELGNDTNREEKSEHNSYKTIYDYKQNVHQVNRSLSIELDKMILLYDDILQNNIPFKNIKENILNVTEEQHKKKVTVSLQRIYDDNLWIKNKYKLTDILSMLWDVIHHSEHTGNLIKCLIEELVYMSDTCTSGHVSRLINTLSGFQILNPKNDKMIEFSIGIGWEEQIFAHLQNKFVAAILSLEDEQFKEN